MSNCFKYDIATFMLCGFWRNVLITVINNNQNIVKRRQFLALMFKKNCRPFEVYMQNIPHTLSISTD